MSEKDFLARLKEHQGIIYKLVHLYADTEEDKKDLYQEILLQAWKSYPGFRGESKFSTWLYRLCLNTIFTLQKKVNRVEYTDTRQFEETFSAEPDMNETERLTMALRTLAETDRAVVSLHLDGYSNQEIGNILGITPNLVGVKFHRAKQQLASLLKNI
ncbi:MAG: RNA polymerase sigma factor [Bacteroidales bacterium]|nr:RNA polymerase sigma factor [Bacteroidales bacterium]